VPDIRYWCEDCQVPVEAIDLGKHDGHRMQEWGAGKPPRKGKRNDEISLLEPSRMQSTFDKWFVEWRQGIKDVSKAYKWAWPGLYVVPNTGEPKVSGGSHSSPTESAALNKNREIVRKCLEKMSRITGDIEEIVKDLDRAGGQWRGTEGIYQRAGGAAPSLITDREYSESVAKAKRRHAEGDVG
jgi:hypothetical protein